MRSSLVGTLVYTVCIISELPQVSEPKAEARSRTKFCELPNQPGQCDSPSRHPACCCTSSWRHPPCGFYGGTCQCRQTPALMDTGPDPVADIKPNHSHRARGLAFRERSLSSVYANNQSYFAQLLCPFPLVRLVSDSLCLFSPFCASDSFDISRSCYTIFCITSPCIHWDFTLCHFILIYGCLPTLLYE